MKRQQKSESPLTDYSQSSRYLGLGFTFAVTVLLAVAGGWWLDQHWGTLPIFTLLGLFVGAAGGFYRLYIVLIGMNQTGDKVCGKE